MCVLSGLYALRERVVRILSCYGRARGGTAMLRSCPMGDDSVIERDTCFKFTGRLTANSVELVIRQETLRKTDAKGGEGLNHQWRIIK